MSGREAGLSRPARAGPKGRGVLPRPCPFRIRNACRTVPVSGHVGASRHVAEFLGVHPCREPWQSCHRTPLSAVSRTHDVRRCVEASRECRLARAFAELRFADVLRVRSPDRPEANFVELHLMPGLEMACSVGKGIASTLNIPRRRRIPLVSNAARSGPIETILDGESASPACACDTGGLANAARWSEESRA